MSQTFVTSSKNIKTQVDLGVMNDHIKNILITISKNPITNVVAMSGTGKTTKLPVGIAEAGNRILVVVSDNSIDESLAGYVESITNIPVSNNITGPENIKYISEGRMKEHIYKIVKEGKCLDLNFADILMIDQANQGSLDQYLIMALWRYCATRGSRVPRLLLVSNTPISSDQLDIKKYNIDTTYYYVEIRYSEKNYPLHPYDGSNRLLGDVARLVFDLHTSSADGDMLIFTTGKLQIESMIRKLEELRMENINIYPAHSDLTKGEIDRIYQETPDRKIIVADKLAETTFTLDKLTIIIDLMADHRPELSLTGGQRYPKRYITKTRANLRSDRGGRYGPVLSYRMITQDLYERLLKDIEPEIYRVPLHWIMLELTSNGIDPFQILDIFDKSILEHMYNLMLRLRLINTNGKVTNIGHFTTTVPYGIRQAAALYYWLDKEYPPYPAIAMLSMIDSFGKSYYIYPMRDNDTTHAEYNLELLEHRKVYFEPFAGPSDVHTYGNIWTSMSDEVGGPDVPSSDVRKWCKDNFIRYENILETISLNRRVINTLNENRSENIEIGPFDSDNLLDLLGPILVDIYHDRKLVFDNRTEVRVRYIGSDMKYYKINDQNGINTIEMDTPTIIFGLITSTVKSEYTTDFHTVVCSLVR